MKFRKLNKKIHLWFGLLTGIVVFIVSITGAIYCFHKEITDSLEPWRFVEEQSLPYIAPSTLVDSSMVYIPEGKPSGITFDGKTGAAGVGMMSDDGFHLILLNPYDASFIRHVPPGKEEFNFFKFILSGHRSLWLPLKIGRPIVGVSVIIFVALLISGLIMWFPKIRNKKALKASFTIKRKANFKRFNFDAHRVLGFYVFSFALILAFTGLVLSFDWFEKGVYYITSGGEHKPGYVSVQSDTTNITKYNNPIDIAFYKALKEEPNPDRIFLSPKLINKSQSIGIYLYSGEGKLYNRDVYYYDQHTLEPIRAKGDRFEDAPFADKLNLMNYDIHTGAILGIWSKIIAFLASLLIATLPLSGFIIWFKKRKKR